MAKYDAFGRKIGEDTLKGLGGSRSKPTEPSWQERNKRVEATWQAAEQAEVARIKTAADAADAKAERAEDARQAAAGESRYATRDPQRRALAAQLGSALSQAAATRGAGAKPAITVRRRGAGRGCLVAMVVLLAILGLLVAGVVGLVSSVDVNSGGTIGSTPERAAPTGLGAGSLVRRADLAAALQRIRTSGGGRLASLRVAPGRVDARLLTPAGRLRNVQVTPGGALERLGSDSGPGFDHTGTIAFPRLDPAAPQRLARAGAERLNTPVSTLQYLVPIVFGRRLSWAAYFDHGRHAVGDASGRFQRAFP